jgi:hypothetical protein
MADVERAGGHVLALDQTWLDVLVALENRPRTRARGKGDDGSDDLARLT